jgi:hypothetical protein
MAPTWRVPSARAAAPVPDGFDDLGTRLSYKHREPADSDSSMALNLFGGKELEEFAKSLAQEIAKRFPPALANDPQRMVSPKRLTTIIEEVGEKAEQFNRDHKLGMLKKASLGNTFQWELKDMGYNDKFVEVATEALIVYITRKPAAGAAGS